MFQSFDSQWCPKRSFLWYGLIKNGQRDLAILRQLTVHDDVIKWKHFPRYWPFVRGIHWSPVNSSHKGQWRGAFMFSSTPSRSLWRHCNDVLKKSQMYFDVIREGTLCFMSLHAMGITTLQYLYEISLKLKSRENSWQLFQLFNLVDILHKARKFYIMKCVVQNFIGQLNWTLSWKKFCEIRVFEGSIMTPVPCVVIGTVRAYCAVWKMISFGSHATCCCHL